MLHVIPGHQEKGDKNYGGDAGLFHFLQHLLLARSLKFHQAEKDMLRITAAQ